MIRIVKMTFKPHCVSEFLENFEHNKDAIRNFNGVHHLELLQDKNNTNTYFTYSIWESEKDLNAYRNSELFKGIWAVTKPMFAEKANAWSVETIAKL